MSRTERRGFITDEQGRWVRSDECRDWRCRGECCQGETSRQARRRERAKNKSALLRDPEAFPVRPVKKWYW